MSPTPRVDSPAWLLEMLRHFDGRGMLDPALYQRARLWFGSLGRAARLAGVPRRGWSRWTSRDAVLQGLREVERRLPGLLHAARMMFGSLDTAASAVVETPADPEALGAEPLLRRSLAELAAQRLPGRERHRQLERLLPGARALGWETRALRRELEKLEGPRPELREHLHRELRSLWEASGPVTPLAARLEHQELYHWALAEYGSWVGALRDARLPWRTVQPRSGRGALKWSAGQVIRTVRKLAREGRSLSRRDTPKSVVGAGRTYFGTWGAALLTAGVPVERMPPGCSWRARTAALAARQIAARGLGPEAASQPGLSEAVQAALRLHGSWDLAVAEGQRLRGCAELQGLPEISAYSPRHWTRPRILHELRSRADSEGTVARADLPPPQYLRRIFGSREAALEAAGVRLRVEEPLLDRLRALAESGVVPRRKVSPGLARNLKSRYGSLEDACARVGVVLQWRGRNPSREPLPPDLHVPSEQLDPLFRVERNEELITWSAERFQGPLECLEEATAVLDGREPPLPRSLFKESNCSWLAGWKR